MKSPPIHPSPTQTRRRQRHPRSTTQSTTSPHLHSRSPRRVLPSPRSLASTHSLVSQRADQSHLHRAREHGQPRRRVPSPGTHSLQPIWRHRRRQTRPSNENHNLCRLLPHHARRAILLSLRPLFRLLHALPPWPRPPSKLPRMGGYTAQTPRD